MDIINTSICVRCGKQRIVVSVIEEKVGNSVIVTKETSCPDSECQKKVEVLLAQEVEKRHQSFLQKQERVFAKKAAK